MGFYEKYSLASVLKRLGQGCSTSSSESFARDEARLSGLFLRTKSLLLEQNKGLLRELRTVEGTLKFTQDNK